MGPPNGWHRPGHPLSSGDILPATRLGSAEGGIIVTIRRVEPCRAVPADLRPVLGPVAGLGGVGGFPPQPALRTPGVLGTVALAVLVCGTDAQAAGLPPSATAASPTLPAAPNTKAPPIHLGTDLGPTCVPEITFPMLLRSDARPSCLEAWGPTRQK